MIPHRISSIVVVGLGLFGGQVQAATTLDGPFDDSVASYDRVANGDMESASGTDLDTWSPNGTDGSLLNQDTSAACAGSASAGLLDPTWTNTGAGIAQKHSLSVTAGADYVIPLSLSTDCAGDSDYDADGDGYDSDGYGGTDCDDGAASTYPGAADGWYDGVDSDCGGNSDYDADGDGWDLDQDCDDGDAAIYPGADGWTDDCEPITEDTADTAYLPDTGGTDDQLPSDTGGGRDGLIRGGGGCACSQRGGAAGGHSLAGMFLLMLLGYRRLRREKQA